MFVWIEEREKRMFGAVYCDGHGGGSGGRKRHSTRRGVLELVGLGSEIFSGDGNSLAIFQELYMYNTQAPYQKQREREGRRGR